MIQYERRMVAFIEARLVADAHAVEAAIETERWDLAADGVLATREDLLGSLQWPNRALREVEAKRRIVARCVEAADQQGIYGEDGQEALAVDVLELLAGCWSDHADYRTDWVLGENVTPAT